MEVDGNVVYTKNTKLLNNSETVIGNFISKSPLSSQSTAFA